MAVQIPPDNTPLMHYLNLYQLLSILKSKCVVFTSVSLYPDALEATLSLPSYDEVSKYLLWEDNTPVKKDESYASVKKQSTDRSDKFRYDRYWKDERWRRIDTFEYLIDSFSRHFMFTHCWSVSNTENILMWDRYKHQDSTVGIKTTMNGIKSAFDETEVRLYVGKIKYKNYQTEHITGFQGYAGKNLSDPDTVEELFYRPVFHKERLYQSENEVRIIMSYRYATESMVGKTYLTDIPFYDYKWGFDIEHNDYDRPDPLWFNTEDDFVRVNRRTEVEVDIDKLIEKIILSPYTESYALSLVQDMVNQYGIAPDKVVKSSIRFR